MECGACEVVLRFFYRALGLAHPFVSCIFIFFEFLLQHVLVGDRDGDLRFHLHVLILHVENHLLDHFFWILGAIDGVVDVGAD